MKNKILLLIIVVLSTILYILNSRSNTAIFNDTESPKVNLLDKTTGKIEDLNLEEYIIGVVAAEMPASFNEEALKAQAIAARTYAMYKINTSNKEYDLVSDISNQGYITKEEMQAKWQNDYEIYLNKITKAVNDTKNIVMTYEDKIIESFYFAMSNGYTENCATVFGESFDYLESVDSPWDKSVNNFEVTNTISKNEFCNKLNISCSTLTINNIERTSSNRVDNITINNKSFKGTEVRALLGLRSTDFSFSINENEVIITTKGYGHGVGMSQYGANEMAKLGKNYEEILKYYYQNIEITIL